MANEPTPAPDEFPAASPRRIPPRLQAAGTKPAPGPEDGRQTRPPGEKGGHMVQSWEQPADGSFLPARKPGQSAAPAADEPAPEVVPKILTTKGKAAKRDPAKPVPTVPFEQQALSDALTTNLFRMLVQNVRDDVAAALENVSPKPSSPAPPRGPGKAVRGERKVSEETPAEPDAVPTEPDAVPTEPDAALTEPEAPAEPDGAPAEPDAPGEGDDAATDSS